jgi:hypothetical protein
MALWLLKKPFGYLSVIDLKEPGQEPGREPG